MFSSFVSVLLSLLTDAVIQAVALQALRECLLNPPAIKVIIVS